MLCLGDIYSLFVCLFVLLDNYSCKAAPLELGRKNKDLKKKYRYNMGPGYEIYCTKCRTFDFGINKC